MGLKTNLQLAGPTMCTLGKLEVNIHPALAFKSSMCIIPSCFTETMASILRSSWSGTFSMSPSKHLRGANKTVFHGEIVMTPVRDEGDVLFWDLLKDPFENKIHRFPTGCAEKINQIIDSHGQPWLILEKVCLSSARTVLL